MPNYILGPYGGDENPLMPLGQVHIFAGESGAGKTTLLLQLLKAMQTGEELFGMIPTAPQKVVYVTFDRSEVETMVTVKRVFQEVEPKFDILKLRVTKPLDARSADHRLESTLNTIRDKFPEATVYVIDAFAILCPHGNINDYLNVAEWLQRIQDFTEKTGVAIIGITHSAKEREGARVIAPRQKMLGSVAGAGFTSCGVVVMRTKPDSDDRTVYLLPRNSPEFTVQCGLDQFGRLCPDMRELDDKQFYFWTKLQEHWTPGQIFTLGDTMAIAQQLKVSKPTAHMWLQGFIKDGRLTKGGHGKYYLTPP